MENNYYLVDELNKGRDLNVNLISHNSMWMRLKKLENRYDTFSLSVSASVQLLDLKLKDEVFYEVISNSDLIIFYSSEFFKKSEIDYLKDLASDISSKKNKKVTIGYCYLTKENNETISEVQITSIDGYEENISYMHPDSIFNVFDLTNMVLLDHDLKCQKNKKRK